jgi:hypothetical protein
MIAIADQTHDELATTIDLASGCTTKGVPMSLRDAPIHSWTHADEPKGAASRGVIAKASRRVGKIATRVVTNQDTINHRIGTLCWRLRTARSGERIADPTGSDSGNGGRPSGKQIQLNKQITAARNADGILAIVETEHGEFNAVNAATACSRLAKTRHGSAHGPGRDNRGVQHLLSTINRVAPSMKPQEVANIIWGLATLGWQAGEGPRCGALEAAAVRVAPSMRAQAVANIIWGLATLGWQAGEGPMCGALETAAVRVAPSMRSQQVANIIWGLDAQSAASEEASMDWSCSAAEGRRSVQGHGEARACTQVEYVDCVRAERYGGAQHWRCGGTGA